jgi:hypothetical protein
MSQARGLLSFAIGGALLLLGVYYILENANKPWIDTGLFPFFFVMPIGFLAFFLLGKGLFLLIKSAQGEKE